MENKKPLNGHVTLITGVGRSAGIGAAICREIAKCGGDIFFSYWQPYDLAMGYSDAAQDDPAKIARELGQQGVRVERMEIDLALPHAAERLFKAAEERLGTPSILVNNACHDTEVPFVELSPEILDQHYAVNIRAVAMLCKEFVRRGRPGRIINMTSGQSLGSMGTRKIPYSITKAAMEMLALQLAPDLTQHGIRIHAVDPGPTDTGWMTDELKATLKAVNAPIDVARLVISILTEERPPTGVVIRATR